MRLGWLLKIRRYDGSESVLGSFLTEREAEAQADRLNREQQTAQYYAEKRRDDVD